MKDLVDQGRFWIPTIVADEIPIGVSAEVRTLMPDDRFVGKEYSQHTDFENRNNILWFKHMYKNICVVP